MSESNSGEKKKVKTLWWSLSIEIVCHRCQLFKDSGNNFLLVAFVSPLAWLCMRVFLCSVSSVHPFIDTIQLKKSLPAWKRPSLNYLRWCVYAQRRTLEWQRWAKAINERQRNKYTHTTSILHLNFASLEFCHRIVICCAQTAKPSMKRHTRKKGVFNFT